MGQLNLPLDQQSKKIIEKTVDEFLEDKIFDLIWKKTFHWTTFFESLDGFSTSGTVTVDEDDVLLTTGASDGDSANIIKTPSWQGLITFSQQSYWRTAIEVSSVAAVTKYLIVGGLASGSYYGFKIVDDSLKGVSYDGSTEKTVDLLTISTSTYNIEARYLPRNKIIFLVESAERGVITENLPSPADVANAKLFEFKVTTNENVAKSMQVSFFEYLQSRNILR